MSTQWQPGISPGSPDYPQQTTNVQQSTANAQESTAGATVKGAPSENPNVGGLNAMVESASSRPKSTSNVHPERESRSLFSDPAKLMFKSFCHTVHETLKSIRNVTAKNIKSLQTAREESKEIIRTDIKASQSKPKTPQQIVENHIKKIKKWEGKLTPGEAELHRAWVASHSKENMMDSDRALARAFSPILVAKNPDLRKAMENMSDPSGVNKTFFTFTNGAIKLMNANTPEKFQEALTTLVKNSLHPNSENQINLGQSFLGELDKELFQKMNIEIGLIEGAKPNPIQLFMGGQIVDVSIKDKFKNDLLSEEGMQKVKTLVAICLTDVIDGIDQDKIWSGGSPDSIVGSFISQNNIPLV